MKSTAEASSGCSIQTVQISPVVTGTGLDRFTLWMSLIRSSTLMSVRRRGFVADDDGVDVAVVPREIERRADFPLVARLVSLSIQAPTVTFSPNSAAIGGTSSAPPVAE